MNTILCPNCNRQTDINKFCTLCGALLPENKTACPKCNAANFADSKYCWSCGTAIAQGKLPENANSELPLVEAGSRLPENPGKQNIVLLIGLLCGLFMVCVIAMGIVAGINSITSRNNLQLIGEAGNNSDGQFSSETLSDTAFEMPIAKGWTREFVLNFWVAVAPDKQSSLFISAEPSNWVYSANDIYEMRTSDPENVLFADVAVSEIDISIGGIRNFERGIKVDVHSGLNDSKSRTYFFVQNDVFYAIEYTYFGEDKYSSDVKRMLEVLMFASPTSSAVAPSAATPYSTPTPVPAQQPESNAGIGAEPSPTPTPAATSQLSTSSKVGDVVKFDRYDWRVLDINNGLVLLASEKKVGNRAYHDTLVDSVTWADSDIRAYLNGAFYNGFSAESRAKIALVTNQNPSNPLDGNSGGADTQDYIFLLSPEEVKLYYGDDSDVWEETHNWWLRMPGGKRSVNADGEDMGRGSVYVSSWDGRIEYGGYRVSGPYCIRAAMWVNPD